jgi:hypothetical protein
LSSGSYWVRFQSAMLIIMLPWSRYHAIMIKLSCFHGNVFMLSRHDKILSIFCL